MATLPPPDVPAGIDPKVASYLRTLNIWLYHELEKKIQKDEAIPSLLLSASDQKRPTAVHSLTVNSVGVIAATLVPLGSS